MKTPESGDWVQLENYPTLIAAEVAKSTLALSGIEAEIFDGETANMNWLYTNALGGVKLMVKSEDYGVSKEILENDQPLEEPVISEADEITSGSLYCSKCHSKDIAIEKKAGSKGFSIAKLFGMGSGGREFRCRHCGHAWRG